MDTWVVVGVIASLGQPVAMNIDPTEYQSRAACERGIIEISNKFGLDLVDTQLIGEGQVKDTTLFLYRKQGNPWNQYGFVCERVEPAVK